MPGSGRRGAWGWHPLRPDWARRLVREAPIRPGDLVLDLGAGTGALTLPLIDAGAQVIAIELHGGRVQQLRDEARGRAKVVQADLAQLHVPRRPFRVLANPPFALTTQVVRTILRADGLQSADLVVQRGAARGLSSRAPSAIAKHATADRFDLQVGRHLPRGAFAVPPSVPCAVLQIRRRKTLR